MPLELDFGPAAEAFRAEVRAWLEANKPKELIGVNAEEAQRQKNPALSAWAKKLTEAGYMCVGWPKEYGGRGLTGVEVAVLNEEFARANAQLTTNWANGRRNT